MTHFKDMLNEAAAPRWAKILKNLDKVEATRSNLSNASLDLAWYGSDRKGVINYSTNTKGTVYRIDGLLFEFATRFISVKEFEILYFVKGSYESSEFITVNKLTKDMLKAKSWTQAPYYLLDKAVTTITAITGDENHLLFHFKNGSTYKTTFGYYKDPIEKKGFIEQRLAELDGYGFKASAKAKKVLPALVPSAYGETEFKLDNTLRTQLDKISKDKVYTKFVNKMSPESRTGWGITINEKEVLVFGMVGNMSSGYRSQRFQFNKQPKTFAAFKKFMIDSGAVDYTIDLGVSIFGEMESYSNYIKNGGALD